MAELNESPSLKRLQRKLKNPFRMGHDKPRRGPGGGMKGRGAALKPLTSKKKKGKYYAA